MSKVSVIIPSYNHKQFIEKTIESVIGQNYPDMELIVIDDGSKDGTPELLKKLEEKFNFKLILKENEGVCATLNRGLKEAKGDFITFIASDDYMSQNRILEQVQFLDSNADIEVVAGAVTLIDTNNNILSIKQPRVMGYVSFDDILSRNVVAAPTAMFRKSVFNKYGLYREDYAFEDYYMWLKILSLGGKIFNTDYMWAFYRINESSFEKRFQWYYKGFVQALTDFLPDARAEKMIQKYRFIFCAKMGLFLGNEMFKKYQLDFNNLPHSQRIIIKVIAIFPVFMRHQLLSFLLKNY